MFYFKNVKTRFLKSEKTWKTYSLTLDVCIHVTTKTDFITALIYDATFAWALAAKKTLEQGIYPASDDMRLFGRHVSDHLLNLDFDGMFTMLLLA